MQPPLSSTLCTMCQLQQDPQSVFHVAIVVQYNMPSKCRGTRAKTLNIHGRAEHKQHRRGNRAWSIESYANLLEPHE